NNNQCALYQVLADGMGGAAYQLRAIQKRHNLYSFRQRLLNPGHAILYPLDNLIGICPFQHHDGSANSFSFTIPGKGTIANCATVIYLGYISYKDRRTINCFHYDVAQTL